MRQPLILRVAAVLLVVLAGIAPAAALDDLAADPVGIEEMTYDLCTFERALGSKERTAAATYIATAMEERGLSVSTGRFSYSNCYFDPPLALSSNIIGVREGSTDRIVVISAHYDTAIPETPGADDNAAGVATMLEAARILNDTPLNHTVYFIAFGGEETGLEGSTRWLADNPDLHNRIIAAINLDCVASGDRLLATALPQHRWILDLLPSCIEETPERLLDAARGDEHAFRAAGIPALRLYERDSYAIIHTPDDQPERLNYTLAAECAAIVAGTIVGIDAADDAPEIDLLVENGTVTFRTPADAPVEVIGVLAAKGQSTTGRDQDDLIVMPLRAFQRRISGNENISLIQVSVEEGASTEKAQEDIEGLLRERRRISTLKPNDFQIRDMKELASTMLATTELLTTLLGAVAAVSLLVGGIGIMNIMLVSVTERTREIGTRLAIGALEREVLLQFLVEAMVLSAFGGLFGIILSLAASAVLVRVLDVPFVVNGWIIFIAFIFSAAVGLIFGYFPARKAASLDPIEALRHE